MIQVLKATELRIEGDLLGDIGETSSGDGALARRILAANKGLPSAWLCKTEEQVDRGRLACPIGTQQTT